MDGCRVIAVFFQRLGSDIHICLAIAENDCVLAGVAFVIDQCAQQFAFFGAFSIFTAGFEHYNGLRDVFRCCCRTCHFDAGRGRQEGVGDPFDFRGHGRRKEQGLACEGRQPKDTFDVWDEPHVQHPVGFIDHHNFDACQQQLAAFEMVQKPARCGDQHVHAPVNQQVLFFERYAANQQCLGQFRIFCVGVKVFRHLCGQFPCRTQDQRTRHAGTGPATGQPCDHRQCETGGFPCPRLCDPQDIFAF